MASTLKVNTIQHTGGTTGMTIDSSGHVLTPAKPSFFTHRRGQGNQNLSAQTFTLVQFNQVDHNIGNHFNTSTHKFTCPVSGVYLFSTQLYIYSTDIAETRIYINDATRYRFVTVGAASNVNPNGAGGSVTVQLSANDTVSVYAYAADACAVYDGSGTADSNILVKLGGEGNTIGGWTTEGVGTQYWRG